MSIENLTQKILSEANSAVEVTIKNAQNSREEILNEAKLKASIIIKDAVEKDKIDIEALKGRKVSAAELQKRKILLSAKQDAVKKSFETALENLKNMEQEKYINILANQLEAIPNCHGELLVNENDKNNIGEKLISVINSRLKEERVKLSQKTINASGGFVLKSGKVEINNTFETLLDSVKDELTFDVASALFK